MSSSVPTAVPAFIAICQAALPANFEVKFGQIFGPRVDPQALLITGIHFTLDAFAVLGPYYKHEEHYNITCALCSASGQADSETTVLATTYGLYSDISVAVANNPNLSNTVRLGATRQLDYTPGYDAKGLLVGVLSFEVECQARVTSLS